MMARTPLTPIVPRLLGMAMTWLVLITMATADMGETQQPYPVQTNGEHIAFADLTKNDLGKKCSVYLKPSHHADREGDVARNPFGIFVNRDGRTIVNGEFNELGKERIVVTWARVQKIGPVYFYPIAEDDIDYIVLQTR